MIRMQLRGVCAAALMLCAALPAQAAPKPLKYVLSEAARPVAGGRAVQVSVGQAELGSNINSTIGFAVAAGGMVGVLIEAKVGADRAQRAQLGITPIRRWGKPEDIGKAVRAIAEDRFPFTTGTAFDVDGGFHLQRL